MSSSLFSTFFHRHVRGSRPQLVIGSRALPRPNHYVGWSPRNTAIALGTDAYGFLYDPATGALLRQWRNGPPMAWSPDGSELLTRYLPDVKRLGEWTFQIRDAETGEVRRTYSSFYSGIIHALSWSPDGTRIAYSDHAGRTGKVTIWDAHDGSPLVEYHSHHQSGYVARLAWSPDSALLVSTDTTGITQLWQSADGTLVRQLPPQELWGNSGGRSRVEIVKLAIAALNVAAPALNFWEAFTEQYMTNAGYLGLLLQSGWSPDGQHLALIEGGLVVVLNWPTGKPERIYGGHLRDKPYLVPPKTQYGPRSLSWSPDGQRIASIDVRGRVHIWPLSVPLPWLPASKA